MIIEDLTYLQLGFMILLLLALYAFLRRSGCISGLKNRAVLVTGCDSGFGYELARNLDKLGVTVFAGCLFPEGPGATDLKKSCSDRLEVVQLDVTKNQHVEDAVQTVKKSLGQKKLWAVVNNAGVPACAPMEWTSVREAERVFNVNTFGPLRVTNAFLPLLRESRGRIVFVASVSGHDTYPVIGTYAMSKHATVALAEAYRLELRSWGISVHIVSPGFFRTNIASKEALGGLVQRCWDSLSQEVKETYGEDYLQLCKGKTVDKYTFFAESETKLYQVVDTLLEATVGRHPKSLYIVGLGGKLSYWAQRVTPTPIKDMILQYFIH